MDRKISSISISVSAAVTATVMEFADADLEKRAKIAQGLRAEALELTAIGNTTIQEFDRLLMMKEDPGNYAVEGKALGTIAGAIVGGSIGGAAGAAVGGMIGQAVGEALGANIDK